MSIEEYLETYENYMRGNYKYRHIGDTEWAEKYIQSGRKIVFGYSRYMSYGILIAVVIVLLVFVCVYIYQVIVDGLDALNSAIILGIVGAILAPFIILGIWLWRPQFFYILGPEGIVYKEKKIKEIQFTRWQDISEITTAPARYRMKSSTITVLEIKIHFVTGKILELDTLSLDLKEFPKEVSEISGQQLRDLVGFVFKRYHECYKNK